MHEHRDQFPSNRDAAFKQAEDLEQGDWRLNTPRFQGENLRRNLVIVRRVEAVAKRKRCTPAQLALAWLLAQGDDIVPIPGTKQQKYLEENIRAVEVELTVAELKEIDDKPPVGVTAGDRYPAESLKAVNR
jgi:aryl-alcohol dehydrogenase-like predicted oxidoreductase